jgi:hypothetical protein
MSTQPSRGAEAKKGRKSSQGLEAEAKAAERATAKSTRPPRPSSTSEARRSRTSRPPPPTEEHPKTETSAGPGRSEGGAQRSPSVADEMDAWPTQQMEGSALADLASEMGRPAPPSVPRASSPPPRPVAAAPVATTQAVRVVVWRTPDGVRVAPLGTAVPAPAVEAMLVALDPSADLTAWLRR